MGLQIDAELDDLGPARPDNKRAFIKGLLDISRSMSLGSHDDLVIFACR
jgi:hypothetical protein